MSIQAIRIIEIKDGHAPSLLEKYALMRAHPTKLFIDTIGFIWAFYFLWYKEWLLGLLIMLIAAAISTYSVRHINYSSMVDTLTGRIALLHLNPVNLTVQLIGAIPLIGGFWIHSVPIILLGFSVILLGHTLGWAKVDSRYALNNHE